jgi:hypothetical protein
MIDGRRISLTTGCLNRTDYLARALDSWLAAPEIDEVVVVDWGNRTPLRESLGGPRLGDPRVVVARVDGQRGWKHSKCHNLEMRLSTGDLVLRIDSDCLLVPGFFAAHPASPGRFYAGNWRLAPGTNEASLNGTVYVHKSDMIGVGGYNERLLHYGYEDDDFYERLVLAGLGRSDLNLKTISHMRHSDRCRYENQEIEVGMSRPSTEKDERNFLLGLIHKNHVAVSQQKRWSQEDQATPWRMEWSDDRRYVECSEIAAGRASGIRDVVFRADSGVAGSRCAGDPASGESEKPGRKAPDRPSPPRSDVRIYSSCGAKYNENLVAQLFGAMRMIHGKFAGTSAEISHSCSGEQSGQKIPSVGPVNVTNPGSVSAACGVFGRGLPANVIVS